MTDSVTEASPADNHRNTQQPKTKTEKVLGRLEKLAKKDDKVLDRQATEFLSSWDDLEHFISQVESWYNKNSKRYMKYMSQYGREIISEVEFKIAMRDLEVPFSMLQIHIIYTWMDPKRTGKVEYPRLYESLYKALYKRFATDDDYKKMNIEYQKKWINMTFKSVSCEPIEMPSSFEALIHLGYSGAMLAELIRSRVPAIASRNFVVFTDPARYSETVVRCKQRLYEFEYEGGPKCAPKEGTIYYEFTTGYIDCPLILDVHLRQRYGVKQLENSRQVENASITMRDHSSSG